MEGFIAILGFWVVMILVVLKRPLTTFIERSRASSQDVQALAQSVQALTERLVQLESTVSTVNQNVIDIKTNAELATLTEQKLQNSNSYFDAAIVDVDDPDPHTTSPKLLAADMGRVLNQHTVQFQRLLPVTADKVWQYLTETDCLSTWLANAKLEPRKGGRVELNFDADEVPERQEKGKRIRGLINTFEPTIALGFSWIDTSSHLESNVSFELSPQSENQTLLTITHSRVPQDRMHEFMAGWHAHLDVLLARLKDVIPPSFLKRFRELLPAYAALVAAMVVSTAPAALASPSSERYQAIQTERSHLLTRYDHLWKDADDLESEIIKLKQDDSLEVQRAVDRLDRQLQDEYRELHKLEYDIRDLDRALL